MVEYCDGISSDKVFRRKEERKISKMEYKGFLFVKLNVTAQY